MNARRFLRWLIVVCPMNGAPAVLVASDFPARDTRHEVCQALQLSAETCAGQVNVLASSPTADGGLRVVSRRPVAGGEQIVLRANTPGSLPFLVLVHGTPRILTSKATPPAKIANAAFDVRAGTIAELVQHGSGITIRRRVRCLERGRAGDWIRVRDVGSGAVLRVQVVNREELVATY